VLLLAIDTSAIASAALVRLSPGSTAGTVEGSFATEDTRSHAEVLAPGVASLFRDAASAGPTLDAIIVGVGPGPFTGLRSGIAMARTLSFAWQVPLHGMCSLDALAWDVRTGASAPQCDFLIVTDARRREVYWARYDAEGRQVQGPAVGPAEELPPLPAYGRGAGLYADTLVANGSLVDPDYAAAQPAAASLGLAAAALLAAGGRLLDSAPLYLRESDAKVPGPRKRAS
jgi:tRNA threonylcarbamoyladenosine biosynthesis protein TsaB